MDGWQTKVVPFTGGVITNQSPYQQGFNNPGSARILINYEPSVSGGYRRINGYTKALTAPVPFHGDIYVQGSGHTGNTVVLANVFENLVSGDVMEIEGNQYTIATSNITYSETVVTLTTNLVSSPADKAPVTVIESTTVPQGLINFDEYVLVLRGGSVFINVSDLTKGTANIDGWEVVSKPQLGTLAVAGAGQSGTTLTVDGFTRAPAEDITFQIAGTEKTYHITGVTKVDNTTYTLDVYPALASSPADNAAITVTGYDCANTSSAYDRPRFGGEEFHIGLKSFLAVACGSVYPFLITDEKEFILLSGIPDDAKNATTVSYNKSTLFLGKHDVVVFSAPANAEDYSAANGGGVISVGNEVSRLITFREQLIVFGMGSILRITGTSIADFQLLPITRDLGCTQPDSVREVGSDIMFLAPDGLRLLGATDRIGDFNLDTVAGNVQDMVTNLTQTYINANISSVVIRNKNQYRIFASGSSLIDGKGMVGANLNNPEGGAYWAWSELSGLVVTHADSEMVGGEERVLFTNDTGYVYWMDVGNSFDGENIKAIYATPFIPFDDPEIRKTMYKMFLYVDPEGGVSIKSSMKFDFNDPDLVLPSAKEITLSNDATVPTSFGTLTAAYGVARYGGSLRAVFKTQLVGSAFAISFFFVSNDTNPPYTLDTMTLEYALRGRR